MICKKDEAQVLAVDTAAGGVGKIYKNLLFDADKMLGKSSMIARIVLPAGSSIGEHPHNIDAELYYILKGEAVVTDNDETHLLHEGDAVFTGDGNRHSIVNKTTEDVEFLAVIFK